MVSAGGDIPCDAFFETASPIFIQFNANISSTLIFCNDQVEGYTLKNTSLSSADIEAGLQAIAEVCSSSFIGFLLEVTQRLSDLTGIDSSQILNIATGGIQLPIDPPLKCIGTELTSIFPDIMQANADIQATIDSNTALPSF